MSLKTDTKFIGKSIVSETRVTGTSVLSTLLNKEQNVRIIEKHVYEASVSNEEYNSILYDVVGDITQNLKLKDIVSNLKNKKVGWKHPCFKEIAYKVEEQNNFIENPFEVEEGVQQCKCGSKRVFSYQKQVRSADEPMTTFSTCCKCGAEWCYSG